MSISGNSMNNAPLSFNSSLLTSNVNQGGANIDGGLTTGDVFADPNTDFLDPDDIQNTLDHFGGSIGGSSMIFGDNPNFLDIHNITTSKINQIFSSDFFPAFNDVNILNAPYIQPVPSLRGNVDAGDVLAASTFFQLGVELSPNLYQTQQYNPFTWSGPSANDILTGSLISQNNILGGNFSWPNNFPNSLLSTGGSSSASLSFTGLPYFGNMFGNPYASSSNSLSSLFGGGLSGGSSAFNPMAGGLLGTGYTGGSLFGDMFGNPYTSLGLGSSQNSLSSLFGGGSSSFGYPGLLTSPTASGLSMSSFGNQVSMLDYIFGQGQGLLGSMGQGLFGNYAQSGYGGLF